MTPQQFAYWLQGYSEIAGKTPTHEQWQVIQDHLKLVFEKQTPERANEKQGFRGWPDPSPFAPPQELSAPMRRYDTEITC